MLGLFDESLTRRESSGSSGWPCTEWVWHDRQFATMGDNVRKGMVTEDGLCVLLKT